MRAVRLLAAALAVAGLLAGAREAAAQISLLGLQNSLVQFALRRISTPERMEITARGVEEGEDGRAELVDVRVADRLGVWLEIDAMGLAWSPTRILRGELEINRLSARGVRVLRRPVGEDVAVEAREPPPPRGLFQWPRAPIATRIEEVRLDGVTVAPGVIAAQGLAFEATGSARDEGNEQAAALTLTRTDGLAARIAFDYLRDSGANTLRLSLDADEAAGGVVAELAGLPPDSASRLALAADGPLTDWRLDFEAAADRVFEAGGEAVVDLTAPVSVTADFFARPGPEMGETARALLAPEARLALRAIEGADGVIRIEEGSIRSPEVTLDGAGTFARATGAIEGTVRLEAGGGLARLAEGLAFDRAGFEGRVSGALDDLAATGALSLDGLRTAPADVGAARLDARLTAAGGRIGFDATGEAEGLRLDRLTPDILGRATLAAAGAAEGGRLTLSRLALGGPLLTATAAGEADFGAGTATLDYRLLAPELAPVAAAYGVEAAGAFEAQGRLDGALDAPRLAGEAALTAIRVAGEAWGGVRLTHDATLGAEPAGRIDVAAEGSPWGPARLGTAFRLADGRLALSDLSAAALGVEASGAAEVGLADGLAVGAADFRIADLGAVGERAALGLSGRAEGRVALSVEDGAQIVGLALDGAGVQGFDASIGRIVADVTLRDLHGAPSAEGTVELAGLDHPAARVRSARFAGRAEDLTGAARATGSLTAEGVEAAGVSAASVAFEGAAEDLRGAGLAEGRLTARGVAAGGATVGSIALDGTARDLAGALAATGTLEAAEIEAGGARIATLRVVGEGAGLATPAPTATVAATVGAIAAGGSTSPGARLDATLTQGAGGARLAASAAVEPATAGPNRIGAATVEATVENAFAPARRIDGALSVGPSTLGGLRLAGLDVAARGPQSALEIAASARGETAAGEPVALDAAARLDLGDPARPVGTVSRLEASAGEARAALGRPLRIARGDGTRLDGIDLALPGGTLTGDLTVHGDGMAGDLRLDLGDVGPLARLADAPLASGTLSASARFDTRPGRARGEATATGRRLIPTVTRGDLGGLSLDARAGWTGSRATVEATVVGPYDQPLRATAAFPLRATGALLPEVPAGAPVDGRVTWAGRLGELWAQVPAVDHFLDGDATIDLRLSGPLRAADVSGEVSLRNGRYEYLETGTILADLTIDSRIAPGGAFEIVARATDGAAAPVEGALRLDDGRIDARVSARDAVLVRRDDVTAALTVDLRAAGPFAGPAVTGTIDVERAEVRLVDATPPSVASLGEVRIRGEAPPPPREPAAGRVTLDLAIRGDDRIFVRGRGLDSEWRMALAVRGTAAAPAVTGEIERIRGVLNLVGSAFDLERGRLTFTGGQPIDPALDVALTRENRGVRGGVILRGTARDPEIAFESSPPLPESEVLPRVLFGTTRQSLTPGQAVQLALGLATLLDGTGGAIDAARATIGVDVLRFEEEQLTGEGEEGRTRQTVVVGTNVADGVFVGAKQPIDGGTTSVTVEIEVFDGVTVDTEVGGDEGLAAGVNWRKDF